MKFIEFVAIIKRHKLLVLDGLLIALLAAVLSAYRLDGLSLVSRSEPVHETTAVVAIKPGREINLPVAEPTTVPSTVPPLATPAGGSVPTTTTTAVTTTTVARPPDDVIDSRSLYYAALSIKTAVVAPGFAEQVKQRVPAMDGSIAAVTALDTNTIRLVVNGSTPTVASETMDAVLSELRTMVRWYADGPAFRFTLEGETITPASTPRPVPSVKGPLTVVLVFGVALVAVWMVIRAVDILQLHRREARQLKRAQDHLAHERRAELDAPDPPVDAESTRVPSP